jgi:hypothetical protein
VAPPETETPQSDTIASTLSTATTSASSTATATLSTSATASTAATATATTAAEAVAPAETMWMYLDAEQIERGPFPSSHMAQWIKDGYFGRDMKVLAGFVVRG